MHWAANTLPSVESSQPGTKIGQVGFAGGDQPAVSRIDLIARLQNPRADHPVEKLVRKMPFAFGLRREPFVQHDPLDAPHGFFFRNARIGDAIQMPIEEPLFVLRRQLAVVGYALVVRMGHEVEHVFLQIRASAADCMHFAAPDHLGE